MKCKDTTDQYPDAWPSLSVTLGSTFLSDNVCVALHHGHTSVPELCSPIDEFLVCFRLIYFSKEGKKMDLKVGVVIKDKLYGII